MKNELFAFYIVVLRKYFVSYCTEKISNFGVTYSQLFVLIYISKKNECFSKEIVEYLKIDAGQLNRILSKLLEKDLIIQRKNSNDRRFNILSLTPNGTKIVEESHKLFYSWDTQVLSDLDDNSREELMDLMKNLILKLNEKDGGKQNEQIKRFYEHIDRKL
jgi:DNA-binding MarR family transcriptional regulator